MKSVYHGAGLFSKVRGLQEFVDLSMIKQYNIN